MAGGDGTIGWVLQAIDNLKLKVFNTNVLKLQFSLLVTDLLYGLHDYFIILWLGTLNYNVIYIYIFYMIILV